MLQFDPYFSVQTAEELSELKKLFHKMIRHVEAEGNSDHASSLTCDVSFWVGPDDPKVVRVEVKQKDFVSLEVEASEGVQKFGIGGEGIYVDFDDGTSLLFCVEPI